MKISCVIPLSVIVLSGLVLSGCNSTTGSTDGPSVEKAKEQRSADASMPEAGKGMEAIKRAAKAGKYLFLFFSKSDDEQTLAMRKVFDKAMEKATGLAESIALDITDPNEKSIVAKFDLNRAPMPLVLVLAPNGAITGGFPKKFEEQQLLSPFATPVTEKVMKELQDGKLVFVCVQNAKTKSNDTAMQGVRDFKADSRFKEATEVVQLDPADPAEASFLKDLKIDPKTEEAMTVFLVPPGSAIAEYKGATNKTELVAILEKASSGSCPGGSCGPGGCAPKQ